MFFEVIDLTNDPIFNYFFSLVFWPGLVIIHFRILFDLIGRA